MANLKYFLVTEVDFNNIETRAVIKFFFFLQGKAPKEIHAILTETLRENAPSYATVKNCVDQFKRCDFFSFKFISINDLCEV